MALDSVVYNKAVDVAQSMPVPVIFAKQGEHHKRKVVVKIMEDGQPFKLASGNTAYVQGATAEDLKTKQRYRFKYNIAETNFADSTITFYIDRGMTQVIGITQCELAIYDSGAPDEILCTANINIEVQGTGMSPEDEIANDDYQAIASIKVEVTAMRDEVRDKTIQAIAAKGAAETAAQNAYNSALGVQKIVAGNEAYTKQEADLKYSVAPRKVQTSTTGELKLTDADYGLSYIELQGNSEQYTNTANINMFDVEYNKSLGLHGTDKFLRTTGEIDVSGNWSYSYYIKVAPNTLYSFVGIPASPSAAFIFYTKDKTYISGIATKDAVIDLVRAVTTPSNCEWMRISYTYTTNNSQMYLGQLPSQGVMGAVETPSPDYPSEVKSVGDIPKDVNGVEIRNILDIDGILAKPESEWTVTAERIFATPLDVSKTKINGRLFKAFDRPDINVGLSTGAKAMTDGTSGFYLGATSIPIKGFDFSLSTTVYLFIYFTGAVPSLTEVKEILDKERNKFVFTYASEVDEYRPYIGENNGLAKIESIGLNHADPKQVLITRYSEVKVNEDNSVIKATQTIIDGGASSYIYFNYEKDRQYTLYCKAKFIELSGTGGRSFVGIRDKTGNKSAIIQQGINTNNVINEVLLNFTATEDGLGVMLYIQPDINTSRRELYVYDLMIVEGEKTLQEMKALKYQPYYNQITWIPLREPLRAMKTAYNVFSDTVDKNGNVTKKIQKMKMSEVPNLDNGWDADPVGINARSSDIKFAYYTMDNIYKLADSNKDIPCLCEKLKYSKNGISPTAESIWHSAVIVFQIKNTRTGLSDAETDRTVIMQAIRNYITTNDYTVYYLLNENDFSNYQISAVYIETYDQETNVRCLNKVKPSSMGLDYKIAISSLIKRLEALESAAVNNGGK